MLPPPQQGVFKQQSALSPVGSLTSTPAGRRRNSNKSTLHHSGPCLGPAARPTSASATARAVSSAARDRLEEISCWWAASAAEAASATAAYGQQTHRNLLSVHRYVDKRPCRQTHRNLLSVHSYADKHPYPRHSKAYGSARTHKDTV